MAAKTKGRTHIYRDRVKKKVKMEFQGRYGKKKGVSTAIQSAN